ncbi:hypothetical protein LNQ81_07010 [Myroides sp. M-43]|uniref:hypothetical protein n=1 Tax=Myroides oncorhynchi TaxID=2893756 RepID=UPI001E5CAC62|nr:hypothetical protein [Myroides oncorhynchi]MCC9042444.1 hypothetical protein [Myroides oncorhynchi]
MMTNTLKVIDPNIIKAEDNTSVDSSCIVDNIADSLLSPSELNKTIDLISIKAFAKEWEQENDEYWNSY